jgi:hypothetical protein
MAPLAQALGEAAEAAEALTDVVAALAALVGDAAERGVDLVHWTTARELAKKGRFLPDRATDLWCMWVGAAARPCVTLADYMAAPERVEWSWDLFQLIVSAASAQLEAMAAELGRQRTRFPTSSELAGLTARLVQWQGVLVALRALDPAASRDDWMAVRRFLARYPALAERLRDFNAAVAAYVRRLKADGKWPIRGD